jgi:pyruvate,water dikinase
MDAHALHTRLLRPNSGCAACADLELNGVAASRGAFTGPARLITSPTSFHLLKPGEVVVCAHVPPSWAILFRRAGAVVADNGGALSNAAVLAREHRLPAVVATQIASSVISDGQLVTVDGDTGVVRLHRHRLARS